MTISIYIYSTKDEIYKMAKFIGAHTCVPQKQLSACQVLI